MPPVENAARFSTLRSFAFGRVLPTEHEKAFAAQAAPTNGLFAYQLQHYM